MSLLEVKVKESSHPVGLDIRIIYKTVPLEANWFASEKDLIDGFAFFGDARGALSTMAAHLANLQKNLATADEADCEKLLRIYSSGHSSSSYRSISRATAELVHGIDCNARPGDDFVIISLEPFDIKIGSMTKSGTRLLGAEDFKFTFMSQNWSDPALTPGTKYILQSLQDAAHQIENIYKKYTGKEGSFTSSPKPIAAPNTNVTYVVEPQKSLSDYSQSGYLLPESAIPKKTYSVLNHEYNLIFTNPEGQSSAVKVKDPCFRTIDLPEGRRVEITGGSFEMKDAVVIEGDLVPASSRSKNAKNPSYWAHAAEDKVNGIKQQVVQNLKEDDPTRVLICAISDLLSDHIHNMGTETN